MDPALREYARGVRGFLPDNEGQALYLAGAAGAAAGPLLEVGSYCGKSAVYLGAAARDRGTVLFSVDHHRGSEEHQPGEQFHDPDLLGGDGRVDSLPCFRRTIAESGLEDFVVAIVGRSDAVASNWRTPLGLVFIDGGHSQEAASADLAGWSRHLAEGALLAIHDVFPNPADGGRPPFRIFLDALESGRFEAEREEGSLRILRRVGSLK